MQTSFSENGTEVAQSWTLAQLARARGRGGPRIPREGTPRRSLYINPLRGPHRWGMVIDLDRCIGCNACVAACYAENNVPIVGREQCAQGHVMSWLTVQSYRGDAGPAGPAGPASPR